MADQHLKAFIQAVRQDENLQARLSTTAAADADVVAVIAQETGFEVAPNDLVTYGDGILVDYEDEDYFMKPRWWQLATSV
jgi:predicted ribosomally synthesized peptide with nif11-like leader